MHPFRPAAAAPAAALLVVASLFAGCSSGHKNATSKKSGPSQSAKPTKLDLSFSGAPFNGAAKALAGRGDCSHQPENFTDTNGATSRRPSFFLLTNTTVGGTDVTLQVHDAPWNGDRVLHFSTDANNPVTGSVSTGANGDAYNLIDGTLSLSKDLRKVTIDASYSSPANATAPAGKLHGTISCG